MPLRQVPAPVPPAIVRQLRSLIRVAELVPRVLAALEAGHVESCQKIGRRRLKDGRQVELWLVTKAPKRDDGPMVCPPTAAALIAD